MDWIWSQSLVSPLSLLLLLFLFQSKCGVSMEPCPPEKLQTCLNMAYQFLENDRFTFPTTKADVEDVCNSWSKFLECIEGYVAGCLDERQKNDFKKAVGTILDSVRNLCTDSAYQDQYFQHADCIKRTCTDDAYCGKFYKKMTRQVSQDFDTNELCCNYHKFDSCVLANTNAICGSTARDFASAMMDKAMSFLATRCQSSGQASESCAGANEISVGPTYTVVTNEQPSADQGARALPTQPTTKWSFTKGPESLAYENAAPALVMPLNCALLILPGFLSFLLRFY